jgi:hypothetical protein
MVPQGTYSYELPTLNHPVKYACNNKTSRTKLKRSAQQLQNIMNLVCARIPGKGIYKKEFL